MEKVANSNKIQNKKYNQKNMQLFIENMEYK